MHSDPIQIYLDMNVIVDCLRGRDDLVKERVIQLRNEGIMFPYSPAHIEEVAVIFKKQKDQEKACQYVAEHLAYISGLSGDWEYLPSDAGIILKKEKPDICFGRVIDMYDWTIWAEQNEQFIQCFRDEKSCLEYFDSIGGDIGSVKGMPMFAEFQKFHGIDKRELANTDPEQVFEQKNIRKALNAKMMMHSHSLDTIPMYKDMVNSHQQIELFVGLLLNFLEEIGYRPEPRGRHRSRMHDVTHAIYATKATYFVTGDSRYRDKAKAVYSFLDIPCRIMSKEEFLSDIETTCQN